MRIIAISIVLSATALAQNAPKNYASAADVQALMEKANFKSVRGNFRYGNNHMPIQSFYLQDVVKEPDGSFVLKTTATIVENDQDRFHDKCPMK